jgi:cytochrome P450
MTTTETSPLRLPFDRPNVLDLAPLYELLRRETPVTAVTTPAGDPAWLATGFAEVRELLADTRLGRSHPEPEDAARITHAAVQDGPTGNYETEEAEHTRMRRLLTPAFSAKRMRGLADHVQRLVDGYVDDMITARENAPDGVVDLHAALSFPLPVAVICELLGVPQADGAYFRDLSDRMATSDPALDPHAAREEFGRYMAGLAESKRADPGEDVITDLVRAQAEDEDFGYGEMTRLAVGLLFAGHETTVNRIDLGMLFLLTRSGPWEALAADPDGRINATVEEVMRLGAPGDLGILRYAHTDLDIAGVTIRRGDAVILSLNAANRDAGTFADPETFDPDREERGHVGFGHGGHFCIGASLARTELRTVFATLAARLPGLRLAADLDELVVREHHITGGVTTLPVTW